MEEDAPVVVTIVEIGVSETVQFWIVQVAQYLYFAPPHVLVLAVLSVAAEDRFFSRKTSRIATCEDYVENY